MHSAKPHCYGCRLKTESDPPEMHPIKCVPAVFNGKKVWACPKCGAILTDCTEDEVPEIMEADLVELRRQGKWRVVSQMSALSLELCDMMTQLGRTEYFSNRYRWVKDELQGEYLTVQSAALLLSCSDRSIRSMIKRGELKAFKFYRRFAIRKEDLLMLLKPLYAEQ